MMSRLDLSDLLEAIISRAGALVGTPNGYIFLLEPGASATSAQSEMEMRIGVGAYNGFVGTRAKRGVGLAGQIWETGEPLAVDDYRNWQGRLASPSRDILRAVAGVPLKSGSQTVGVIGLAYLEEGRVFGEDEMVVLNRFAQLASIALDNSRLYTDLQHQREHLQLANQAGQLLTTEMSVSGVLDAALALAPHLGAEHSYVLVLGPDDRTYFKGTVPGLEFDDAEGVEFGQVIATRGLEKWVLENRQPALVTDSRTDPRWYTAPHHVEEEPARSVVAVPVAANPYETVPSRLAVTLTPHDIPLAEPPPARSTRRVLPRTGPAARHPPPLQSRAPPELRGG